MKMSDSKQAESPSLVVILAAGLGTRLYAEQKLPKPLTKILGLTLAERSIATFKQDLGISRFVVVVGHEAARVRQHFEKVAAKWQVSISFVESMDWKRGNGASALAAQAATGKQPFYLVMVDHLFDPEIVRQLAAKPLTEDTIWLAVDHDKSAIFDLDDVTCVRLDGDRIVQLGKRLPEWNAADTGIFLCSAGLFEGLERAAKKGHHGLSDGITELASDKRAHVVDVTGCWWLDVDTLKALKAAETELLRRTASKSNDGPIARHLNRPISRFMTRYLINTPITPNQISVGSWLLSCVAAVLLALGGYPALVAGGVMAQFASIVDGCDGEIARLKRQQSEFGGWFDAVLDRYADAFLLFALTWHGVQQDGKISVLLIGFAAILGSFMTSYTADKYDSLMASFAANSPFRIGRDLRVFIIFLGAIFNLPVVALTIIAVIMNLEVVRRIVLAARANQVYGDQKHHPPQNSLDLGNST
ncbi:MAG: hypothetical protein E2O89_01480 [Alphaproteobacteria bacterium]|nr:MAG: hypothetical protein E2O89_01480 [Alphaproteobacteria bacterium]